MSLDDNDFLRALVSENDVNTLIVPAIGGGGLKCIVLVTAEEIYGEPGGEGSRAGDFPPRCQFINGMQNFIEVSAH